MQWQAKLPKMYALKKSRLELAARKKALRADYREAQKQMRELVAVKGNVDHLLDVTDGRQDKEQARIGAVTQQRDFGTTCPEVPPGLGRFPNKQKSQVWPHLHCLPERAGPESAFGKEQAFSIVEQFHFVFWLRLDKCTTPCYIQKVDAALYIEGGKYYDTANIRCRA